MGFFEALGKLGKAAVGTVMLPIDVARDAVVTMEGRDARHIKRRTRKISDNVNEALNEIDQD